MNHLDKDIMASVRRTCHSEQLSILLGKPDDICMPCSRQATKIKSEGKEEQTTVLRDNGNDNSDIANTRSSGNTKW